ncbi:naringenin-2-oxoglutarate 3-dioxygenase [Apiospora kogelbergensis]|uniref:Naringenin-2-oxoglutarate 3-dioxygenase n=1 Tax=Apiospora kogelbergensis TaxID=1337665 RepID=A0AAW0QBL0_9PEZI
MANLPDKGQLNLPVIDISPFISWNPSEDETASSDLPKDHINGDGSHPEAHLPRPATPADLTPTQRTTVAALRTAVRHPGFFYLTGHGVPRELMQRVLELGRQFYTAGDDSAILKRKRAIARRPCGDKHGDGARGWQDVDAISRNDWHEALDFYAEIAGADTVAAHRAFKASRPDVWPGVDGLLEGRNLYPNHPAAMRALLPDYVARLCSVGEAVMRALGFALELRDPEFFAGATRDSFWCLRVLGYPPLPPAFRKKEEEEVEDDEEDEEIVGCGAHSDYGCLTMLLTDETPGALKVRVAGGEEEEQQKGEKQPEQWVDADPLPGAYVVNIGDMVEQWTGGWATSTVHKVLHTGDDYRISVPFFYEPAKHVIVRRLPEFGGTDADAEVRYWDHLVSKIDGSFFRKRTSW